jgi:hypothetical protein
VADKTLIQAIGVFVGLIAWDADPSAFAAGPQPAPAPIAVAGMPAAAPSAVAAAAGLGDDLIVVVDALRP